MRMTVAAGLVAALAALSPLGAGAQSQGPFGGFKHDRSKPIEIESDSLEVRQGEGIAIFAGKVQVGQGTLRMDADRMVVAYDEEESDSETGAIQNVKAEGNVFLSNGAETAEGDFAEYDVAIGMMFMRGNVLLTQGGNAIAGNALEINLNTGRAVMQGRATETGSGGRVKSIFRPASRQPSN